MVPRQDGRAVMSPAAVSSVEPDLDGVEHPLAFGLGAAGVAAGVLVGQVAEGPGGLAVALGPFTDGEAERVPEAMGVHVDGTLVLGGLVRDPDEHLVHLAAGQGPLPG